MNLIIDHDGTAWNAATPGLTQGSLHFIPNTGTSDGNGISFGATDSGSGETGMAGIYVVSDSSYGSRMYLATTNSYAAGSQSAISILEQGNVSILRGHFNVEVGNIQVDVGGGGIGTAGNVITGMVGDTIFMDQQVGYARLYAYDWTAAESEPLRILGETIDFYLGTAGSPIALALSATAATFLVPIVAGTMDADFDAITGTSYGD